MLTTIRMSVLTLVLVASGCAKASLLPVVPSAAPVHMASVQVSALTVTRNPEAGPGMLGSFNVINGNRSTETLRFFGSGNAITQVTVQTGQNPPRPVTPAEAAAYSQLVKQVRPDRNSTDLNNLLVGWAAKARR